MGDKGHCYPHYTIRQFSSSAQPWDERRPVIPTPDAPNAPPPELSDDELFENPAEEQLEEIQP